MDGKFRIGILQNDISCRDSGEGPWDSYGEAEAFQSAEVGVPSVIIGGHPLEVTLEDVQVNKKFSRETLCFCATLVVDGHAVADVENTGGGGSHIYLWKDHFWRKIVNAWALAQPTEYPFEKLDQIVNGLVDTHLAKKKGT